MRSIQRLKIIVIALGAFSLLAGCAIPPRTLGTDEVAPAVLTPVTGTHADLISLPEPKGQIVVSVYNFRDQTGQYKYNPVVSSFSTAVTQGAASMLIEALKDSGWFIPVEREGLQDLLTERKIIRAANQATYGENAQDPPPLLYSQVLLEGGIVAYETNTLSGGAGARYFGVGASEEYRVDQVTVYLRAVDISTGRILNSVSTTKSIYSIEVRTGVFRFVHYKRLLELEAGYTTNEPAQLCVLEAIEKAVLSLIVEGLVDNHWVLKDPMQMNAPVIQAYLEEKQSLLLPGEVERWVDN